MKQNFGIRASILQNSNKLYSSSFCDWRGVREGAYFQFNGDKFSFNVLNSKLENYSKSFTVKNKNTISIPFNFNPILIKDDIINLHYKEFRASKLLFIINPGKNYRINDIVFCIGGTLNQNYQTSTSFKVTGIGENGEVTELEIIENGKYIKLPENKNILTYSDGPGQNLELAIEFEEDITLGSLEGSISNISFGNNETTIILSNIIPDGILQGEIRFSKWLITLTSNYNLRNSNVIGEQYEINNDLISGSELVKINKDNFSLVNKNFEILIREINSLKERLNSK